MRPSALLPVLTLAALAASSCQVPPGDAGAGANAAARADVGDPRAEEVRAWFIEGLGALATSVDALVAAVVEGRADDDLRVAFEAARDDYKTVEFLLTYYSATAAGEINGPALPEVWEDDPNQFVHPPEGFQVLEEMLYPTVAPDRDGLANEVRILRSTVRRVQQLTRASSFGDAQVWEAARQQVVRVASLGVSGFDSPVARRSIPEAATALDGVREGLAAYVPPAGSVGRRAGAAGSAVEKEGAEAADAAGAMAALARTFRGVAADLRRAPDFDAFDRVAFFRDDVPALLTALVEARAALEVPLTREPKAIRPDAVNLFAADAVDPEYFAPLGRPPATAAQVELGRRLFFEPALSGGGERSCATCHLPERGFTDGLPRSRPLGVGGPELRNAPTVLNAGLQAGSFYDLRTEFLEDQVADVVRNPHEMRGDLDQAAERVLGDPRYGDVLHAVSSAPGGRADGATGRATLTGDDVRRALAAYVRSLVALDSRFDRYMRGQDVALSDAEKRGFNLFMGRAACGTCHFAPLFNGTVPPAYRVTEVEILGVPADPDAAPLVLDPDPGRAAVYGIELYRHAFKTTTVRNVEVTAPYMHHGAYETLEDVVRFYDAGGGVGLGLDVEHQTLPPDSLRLTDRDVADLVDFMKALTDTTGLATGERPGLSNPRAAMRP